MTEGLDFYPLPPVWFNAATDQYASIDEGTSIRHADGEAFYSVSGELLGQMLRLAGFEPIGETR